MPGQWSASHVVRERCMAVSRKHEGDGNRQLRSGRSGSIASSRNGSPINRTDMQSNRRRNRFLGMGVLLVSLAHPVAGMCYESDVHFGLTLWLAKEAGYEPGEAEAIALADQRMDAGSIEYMTSPLQFACLSRFPPDAVDSQVAHYPSAGSVPVDARSRPVVPEGEAAVSAIEAALHQAGGSHAAFMLGAFGRSLHSLQDSWAHRGIPSVPDWSRYGIACDSRLAMAAPVDRATPSSHDAELTALWPADALDMAKSTYAQLQRYPGINGRARNAVPWEAVQQALPGFVGARTKSEKSRWFAENGIDDTSFLDGTSLPNGPAWKDVRWKGRRDIPAPVSPAMQSGIDRGLSDFYTRFFTDWLTTSPVDKCWLSVVAAGGSADSRDSLVSQLLGWRLRDHGEYLSIERNSGVPIKQALKASHERKSFAVFSSLNDAVLPLIVEGDKPSPILPFIVFRLSTSKDGHRRAIALVKLLDSPYDTVGIVAEQRDEAGWKVTALISSADY
ncbi:hypothetical protein PQQ99_30770 [Paraburkholderia sediminicola]|uniref:Uncharacterized protein n=3 Tax=Paraburkholderia TaxID=1822464 RepID=A0ABW9E2L4_9BURK